MRLLDCVPGRHAKTLGADKGYDMRDFVRDCRARKVTPHVARNDAHQGDSAIDGRTSRLAGFGVCQVIRKRIEEHFGWSKTVGRIRQTAYRGIRLIQALLSHAGLSTTPIYTHVAIGKLKAIHATTHPTRQGPVDRHEGVTLLLAELEREAREEADEADGGL